MRTLAQLTAALTLVAVVAGCSPAAPSSPYDEIAPASLAVADAIPAPTSDVVLTVSGRIAKSNGAAGLEFDLPTLERLGLVAYETHDPWLNEDLRFSGVLLSTFLDAVGAPADVRTVRFRAIDDYEVDIAVDDARRWPILLATRTNGEPMPIADKGPTRIVFPYDQYADIDQLRYKDLWIWQIAEIKVS